MLSFLQQPYPLTVSLTRKLILCGCIGAFVALFLALFKPFDIGRLPPHLQWSHSLAFGAVTFLVSLLAQVAVPIMFPPFFREAEWRSWKEILFLLLTTACIGAGNLALMHYLYGDEWNGRNFWRVQLITLQVGLFPITFLVFLKQLTLYRRYLAAATAASATLPEEEAGGESSAGASEMVRIWGEGQGEALAVRANDLFYIAAADNYVRVLLRDGEGQRSVLIRSTLKKMEDQLKHKESFFRCHRTCLVNLMLVQGVSGNAQGLKLHLAGLEEPVPVSRNLTGEVKDRLSHLCHSPRKASR